MKGLCFTGHREFIDSRNKDREERLRTYLEKLLTAYVEEKGLKLKIFINQRKMYRYGK